MHDAHIYLLISVIYVRYSMFIYDVIYLNYLFVYILDRKDMMIRKY